MNNLNTHIVVCCYRGRDGTDLSVWVAYASNHMKTKTDQHATHNTLKSVPTLPR